MGKRMKRDGRRWRVGAEDAIEEQTKIESEKQTDEWSAIVAGRIRFRVKSERNKSDRINTLAVRKYDIYDTIFMLRRISTEREEFALLCMKGIGGKAGMWFTSCAKFNYLLLLQSYAAVALCKKWASSRLFHIDPSYQLGPIWFACSRRRQPVASRTTPTTKVCLLERINHGPKVDANARTFRGVFWNWGFGSDECESDLDQDSHSDPDLDRDSDSDSNLDRSLSAKRWKLNWLAASRICALSSHSTESHLTHFGPILRLKPQIIGARALLLSSRSRTTKQATFNASFAFRWSIKSSSVWALIDPFRREQSKLTNQ